MMAEFLWEFLWMFVAAALGYWWGYRDAKAGRATWP